MTDDLTPLLSPLSGLNHESSSSSTYMNSYTANHLELDLKNHDNVDSLNNSIEQEDGQILDNLKSGDGTVGMEVDSVMEHPLSNFEVQNDVGMITEDKKLEDAQVVEDTFRNDVMEEVVEQEQDKEEKEKSKLDHMDAVTQLDVGSSLVTVHASNVPEINSKSTSSNSSTSKTISPSSSSSVNTNIVETPSTSLNNSLDITSESEPLSLSSSRGKRDSVDKEKVINNIYIRYEYLLEIIFCLFMFDVAIIYV